MKHLVIGASGLVGTYLCKEIQALRPTDTIVGTFNNSEDYCDKSFTSIKLDITNFKETFNIVRAIEPDVIWITASYTNVNGCESDKDASFKVNVSGPANIALAISGNKNCKIIFFSTDYVFKGDSQHSVEEVPNPLNVYGSHKLLAEHYISTTCLNWLIIRTSNIFGKHPANLNFAARTIKAFEDKSEIVVRKNQVDTPTYAKYLARFSINSLNNNKNKVLHYSSEKPISRKDFGRMIIDRIASPLNAGFRTVEIQEREFKEDVSRPNGGLIGDSDLLGNMIADFKEEMLSYRNRK